MNVIHSTIKRFLSVDCPPRIDILTAYAPLKPKYFLNKQNLSLVTSNTVEVDLLTVFNHHIDQGVDLEHCKILTGSQVIQVLQDIHCCSTINYLVKASSESTSLKIVTNSS